MSLLLLFAALGVSAPDTQAQRTGDVEQTRAQLRQLESDIAKITKAQRRREAARSSLQTELRDSETALGILQKRLHGSEAALADNRAKISTGRERQAELDSAATAQFEAVARELRSAWKGRSTDQLKILLSESDPQRLARNLAYYRYILAARTVTIDRYQTTLSDLAELERQLRERENRLQDQRAAINTQQNDLLTRQAQRKQVLVKLEEQLASNASTLAASQRDQQDLEQVLKAIEEALAQLVPEEDVQTFTDARGAMPWPVEGRITNRFGRSRNQGKMRWQGVRLKAEAGASVNAIHHGQVVYADWLRGSGLLMVIDHGGGYMSLYAHNESLLREVGDWVSADAPIATVGDSGGQSEPGLYFEIRKDGKPTDPQSWCRS